MGNTFGQMNPMKAPAASMPQNLNVPNSQAGGFQYSYTPIAANMPGGKQDPTLPTQIGISTPNLFNANANMPANFSGNQPIFNPSAILQAYQKYLPQFMQGTIPMTQYQNPQMVSTPNPDFVQPQSPFQQLMKNLSSGRMPSFPRF